MGTCNYITQSDFDLYTIEYHIDDEDIARYEDEFGDEFDVELDSQIFYEDIYRAAERLADRINKELIFNKIIITGGYYYGVQTIIYGTDWQAEMDYFEELDNDDCQYYFGMCRSKAIRKYKAEVNRINKKLLPLFEKELGFDHIRCIGVFSNGEAIYERVK